ncbi:MAG: lysophospholipid acyltransferase family protein [Verrucomicrobiota bacterium]
MQRVVFLVAWGLVRFVQLLPLKAVAQMGRVAGTLAYHLDGRHRRVALNNLTRCFGQEMSASQIRALAQEHFRRLGENYCAAVKSAAMPWTELSRHVEFVGTDKVPKPDEANGSRSCVIAIGHFGNFEVFSRYGNMHPGYRCAATYRALKQPLLNQLLQSLRSRGGCHFFERRSEARALMSALAEGKLLLGLLADQHAGERGVRVPFFGQECSTTPAPAILALRYDCPLFTAICYRVALAYWRIEVGDAIPTQAEGRPRSAEEIMTDVTRAFEAAVRRDPANWFWVHNRWKPFRSRAGQKAADPA